MSSKKAKKRLDASKREEIANLNRPLTVAELRALPKDVNVGHSIPGSGGLRERLSTLTRWEQANLLFVLTSLTLILMHRAVFESKFFDGGVFARPDAALVRDLRDTGFWPWELTPWARGYRFKARADAGADACAGTSGAGGAGGARALAAGR